MDSPLSCSRTVHLPLLTDMYQVTMTYAYWKNNMTNKKAVFEVFFRKNPFGGAFTVFAGLHDCLEFIHSFHYTEEDILYIKSILPETVEPEFFDYLRNIRTTDLTVYAMSEGSVVFPKEPLIRLEGPLPICQLLETTVLTLVNYASLVATNAARYRLATESKSNVTLFEFGLRRAQGPDGGLSASKFSYIGGFDGTSNLLAGKMFNIPVKGTHAHSFIMSHMSSADVEKQYLLTSKIDGWQHDLLKIAEDFKNQIDGSIVQLDRSSQMKIVASEMNNYELTSFVAYAVAFPDKFIALVDTFDSIKSGLGNFCAVALALNQLGYRSIGVRIDSGDLAYQSNVAYGFFKFISNKFNLDWFPQQMILVSNDINEETIISLNEQKNHITAFGIGTHLVTCQRQPALGCVFKIVEVDKEACIKLSQDVEKVSIPSRKKVFRLYGHQGFALCDLMICENEEVPKVGEKILCRHPFQESKRCYVTPSKVEELLQCCLKNGQLLVQQKSLQDVRQKVLDSLQLIRSDVRRPLNATPYKVSVTDDLYQFMHKLWLDNAPVGELC